MTTIRRISHKELRGAVAPGKVAGAPPTGISPILRASWRFAQNMAQRFSKELQKDRVDQFLKAVARKFS
ncbi:MAG: hypothetical protein PHH60_04520 [Candidatus Margulisbacteria bacterium]|nr:hypothetical protein [Candidatus Margulisiibacteriota bacterium]